MNLFLIARKCIFSGILQLFPQICKVLSSGVEVLLETLNFLRLLGKLSSAQVGPVYRRIKGPGPLRQFLLLQGHKVSCTITTFLSVVACVWYTRPPSGSVLAYLCTQSSALVYNTNDKCVGPKQVYIIDNCRDGLWFASPLTHPMMDCMKTTTPTRGAQLR